MTDRIEGLLGLRIFLGKRDEAHYLLRGKIVYISPSTFDSLPYSEAAALVLALGATAVSPTPKGATALFFRNLYAANDVWEETLRLRDGDDNFTSVYESDLRAYIHRLLERLIDDDWDERS